MNLFTVSTCPVTCARQLPDKLVVKMILETAQLLSTAHHEVMGTTEAYGVPLYKPTHKNHPCAVWVRASRNNYHWAFDHFVALCEEYTRRYGKVHATETKLRRALCSAPDALMYTGLTTPPACMPDEYKAQHEIDAGHWPCESYRRYLAEGKSYTVDVAKAWAKADTPPWWAVY
jgi:hypothetical protein